MLCVLRGNGGGGESGFGRPLLGCVGEGWSGSGWFLLL